MGIGQNVRNHAMGDIKHPKDIFSEKRVTEERNAREILQRLKHATVIHVQVFKNVVLPQSCIVFFK